MDNYPEVAGGVGHIHFDGQGQRLTPVGDLRTTLLVVLRLHLVHLGHIGWLFPLRRTIHLVHLGHIGCQLSPVKPGNRPSTP